MAAQDGVQCEVIDLQTLYPFDKTTLVNSVTKTGKCIISHEAPVNIGLDYFGTWRGDQCLSLRIVFPQFGSAYYPGLWL